MSPPPSVHHHKSSSQSQSSLKKSSSFHQKEKESKDFTGYDDNFNKPQPQPRTADSNGLTQLTDTQILISQANVLSSYLENFKSSRQDLINNQILNGNGSSASAQDKLCRLSRQQFLELSTDVSDEIGRRLEFEKNNGNAPPFLLVNESFHPKRNQVRQKLATLAVNRFKELAVDVLVEIRRRVPATQSSLSSLKASSFKQTSSSTALLSTQSFDRLVFSGFSTNDDNEVEGEEDNLDNLVNEMENDLRINHRQDGQPLMSPTQKLIDKSADELLSTVHKISKSIHENRQSLVAEEKGKGKEKEKDEVVPVENAAESVMAILQKQKEQQVSIQVQHFTPKIQTKQVQQSQQQMTPVKSSHVAIDSNDPIELLNGLRNEMDLTEKQEKIFEKIIELIRKERISQQQQQTFDGKEKEKDDPINSQQQQSKEKPSTPEAMRRAFSMTLDVSRFLKSTDSLFKACRSDKNDLITVKCKDVEYNTNAILLQAETVARKLSSPSSSGNATQSSSSSTDSPLISQIKESCAKTTKSLFSVSQMAQQFSQQSSKDLLSTFDLTVGHLISAVVELAQRVKQGQNILDEEMKQKLILTTMNSNSTLSSSSSFSRNPSFSTLNTQITQVLSQPTPSLPKSPSTADLKWQLEARTDEIVHGIQKLLTALKSENTTLSSLSTIISSICLAVDNLLAIAQDSLTLPQYSSKLSKSIQKISNDLVNSKNKFSLYITTAANANDSSASSSLTDKSAKQVLAMNAYDLAKETRELVSLFEQQ